MHFFNVTEKWQFLAIILSRVTTVCHSVSLHFRPHPHTKIEKWHNFYWVPTEFTHQKFSLQALESLRPWVCLVLAIHSQVWFSLQTQALSHHFSCFYPVLSIPSYLSILMSAQRPVLSFRQCSDLHRGLHSSGYSALVSTLTSLRTRGNDSIDLRVDRSTKLFYSSLVTGFTK